MKYIDKLRNMTVEEMAKFLVDLKDCNENCLISDNKHCFDICDNQQKLADWLNREVDG